MYHIFTCVVKKCANLSLKKKKKKCANLTSRIFYITISTHSCKIDDYYLRLVGSWIENQILKKILSSLPLFFPPSFSSHSSIYSIYLIAPQQLKKY